MALKRNFGLEIKVQNGKLTLWLSNTRNEIKKKVRKIAVASFEQSLANDKKKPKLLHAYISSRQKTKTPLNAIRKHETQLQMI